VLDETQKALRDVFGMELVELETRDRKPTAGGAPARIKMSNSFIVRSVVEGDKRIMVDDAVSQRVRGVLAIVLVGVAVMGGSMPDGKFLL
jgi:hypothetical protein